MTSTCPDCGATLENPAETVDHYDSRGRFGTPCDMRQRRNERRAQQKQAA